MKELSIEEKAKAYNEAIERAKSKIKNDKDHVLYEDDIREMFHSLKESDDEKIRKELIEYHKAQAFLDGKPNNKHVKFVTWLEKQGEQKPIKAPKFKVGDFIQFNGMGYTRYTVKEVCGLSHYINTCNKRMDMSYTDANFELVEQKPAECSEEDEKTIHLAYEFIRHHSNCNDSINGIDCPILIERLKSLRPQPHWKPSEGHIFALESVIDSHPFANPRTKESLQDLVKQLKAL